MCLIVFYIIMKQVFKYFILITILLYSSKISWAQDSQPLFSLSGVTIDEHNDPLTLIDLVLTNTSNQNSYKETSDLTGNFIFKNLIPGNYILQASALEMKTQTVNFTIIDSDIASQKIKLTYLKATELKDVTIVGSRIPVQQKDDTTQYDAAAFKTNKDASAEDLLKKMPGMDMTNGAPKTQGETVSKVLIDGKPFFGDDPTSALKNLPAEVIDKIQVYDEKSEQSQFTGFDDGNTSKTINIITRGDKKQGTFGRLYAGAGNDLNNEQINNKFRYNGGGNINYFKGDRRISVMGIVNNINQQNFQSQDLLGVSSARGGGRGGSGRPGMSGSGDNFMVGSREGIANTNSFGINYSDKFGLKTTLTASYLFNNSNTDVIKSITRTYPETGIFEGQIYSEDNVANTKNFNHRLNVRMEFKIDSMKSILVMPNVSFQTNNSYSTSLGNTYITSKLLSNTNNNYESERNGYNATLRMLYRQRFAKRGRSFSVWMNGGANNNKGNNWLYALNNYEDLLLNDTLDQLANLYKNGWNASANFNYTEPLSKKSGLQVEYKLGYQNNESDKQTWNYDPTSGISGINGSYTDFNRNLSNTFSSQYLTNAAGLGYRYADTNFNFNLGVNYQLAQLLNNITYPTEGKITRDFHSILPNARMEYKFSKSKSWRLFYRTNTNNPSVDQLQTVVDNSNPLMLSTGNDQLKQAYTHTLRTMYSSANTSKSSTFFAMLAFNKTNNYIANGTFMANNDTIINNIVLAKGVQLQQPVNLNGQYNLNSFITYGLPIKPLRSNFNMNANLGYSHVPSMINNTVNFLNNTNLGLGIVLSSNISDKVDFTISSNANYSVIRNTVNTRTNNEYYIHTSKASLNYIFWKGLVFNTDLTHYAYTGLSQENNLNYFLWNASIGKKLFKDEQAEIRFSVYDILRQNTSISTSAASGIYFEETRVNALQSYFLLTFSWNLRYFKAGSSIKDGQPKEEFPGGPPSGAPFRP